MYSFKSFTRSEQILPAVVDFDILKKICRHSYDLRDSGRIVEIKAHEINNQVSDGDSEEQIQSKLNKIKEIRRQMEESLVVSVTVEGHQGEKFTFIPARDLDELFSKMNFPSKITKITFENWSYFHRITNFYPFFQFTIELDFSDLSPISLNNDEVVNQSKIYVSGLDETWVAGTLERFRSALLQHRSDVSNFLYKVISYDMALWFVGLPLICYVLFLISNLSNVIKLMSQISVGLTSIYYLILGLLLINIFSLFYNYLLWLFPYMELVEQKKKLQKFQKSIAFFIIAGIFSGWLSTISELLSKLISK